MATARGTAGFTLLEIMITVAIVAILGGVAYPMYADYLTRSRLIGATTNLSDFRVKMEQFFQDNRRYDDGAGACGVPNPPAGPNDSFQLACALSANGYTVNANGLANLAGVQYRLVVNNALGVARSTPTPVAGWSAPVPNNCWAIRKNGTCS